MNDNDVEPNYEEDDDHENEGGDDEAYDDDYEAEEKSPAKIPKGAAGLSGRNALTTFQRKKKGPAIVIDQPTLSICVCNLTLLVRDASQRSSVKSNLTELAVHIRLKNLQDTPPRPSVQPISGKFPVQYAHGVNEHTGDLDMNEPEDFCEWDDVLAGQADSCHYRWKEPLCDESCKNSKGRTAGGTCGKETSGGGNVPSDNADGKSNSPEQHESCSCNTVEITLKAGGEAMGRGRVRLQPMYTPYLKPGDIHYQRVYLNKNVDALIRDEDAYRMLPKPLPENIVARLTLGFHLQLPKIGNRTAGSKKSGIYASSLPLDQGSSKMFELLLTQQAMMSKERRKSKTSSSNTILPKSKLQEKIKELSAAKKMPTKKTMKFATQDELDNVRFKPKKDRAAKYAAKNCNYDFMNGTDTDADFLTRSQAKQRDREDTLRQKRGEEAFEAILDKKVCGQCGKPQAYDEMINKKDCTRCEGKFISSKSWGEVGRGFSKRMEEDRRRREEKKQKALHDAQSTVPLHVSKTQQKYKERITQRTGSNFQERMKLDAERRQKKQEELKQRKRDEELQYMSNVCQPSSHTQRSSVRVASTFDDRLQASMADHARKMKRSAAEERRARQSTNLRANGTGASKRELAGKVKRGTRPVSAPSRRQNVGFR